MSNRIGKYEIEINLGRGAFTRVYRARDAGSGRQVALKLPAQESGVELFSYIQHEAAMVAKLSHRNIVEIYDWGEHQGQPFLALEYLEGVTMRDAIVGRRSFTLAEKTEYLSQLAIVLQAALQTGSVHLDFKPSSLMLLSDGTLKCMDFGMVQLTAETARRLAQQGYLEGSIRYASPEQLADTSQVDTLSDVFSYGVVYYEFLAGRHPFEAPNTREMIARICQGEAAPLRSLCPDCPERLERIVSRAMRKDRGLRYASLEELDAEARQVWDRPQPAPTLSLLPTMPWWKQPAVSAVAGILLAAGAAGWHWRSAASRQTVPVVASAPVTAPPLPAIPAPAPEAPPARAKVAPQPKAAPPALAAAPEPAQAEVPEAAEPPKPGPKAFDPALLPGREPPAETAAP